MNIKINGKRTKLKSSVQLTCAEYIQLMTDPQGLTALAYINAVTDFDFTSIQDFDPKAGVFNAIKKYVGDIKDINFFFKKGKPQQKFVFHDQLINLKEESSTQMATRQAYSGFAEKQDKNIYEAALFILAVIVNNIVNPRLKFITKSIEETYNELLNKNFLDTMPSAVFFLKKLRNG